MFLNPKDEFRHFCSRESTREIFRQPSIWLRKKAKSFCSDALGLAVVEPEKIERKLDTIYDLASLTKVLVTGLLCAKLIDDGRDKSNWQNLEIFCRIWHKRKARNYDSESFNAHFGLSGVETVLSDYAAKRAECWINIDRNRWNDAWKSVKFESRLQRF